MKNVPKNVRGNMFEIACDGGGKRRRKKWVKLNRMHGDDNCSDILSRREQDKNVQEAHRGQTAHGVKRNCRAPKAQNYDLKNCAPSEERILKIIIDSDLVTGETNQQKQQRKTQKVKW